MMVKWNRFNPKNFGASEWAALGGTLLACGLAFYSRKKWRRKAKTLKIKILPENTLLELFDSIRRKYSHSVKAFRNQARKQRRKLDPCSREYIENVLSYYKHCNKLCEEAINETLSQKGLSRDVYDNSVRYYKHEPTVYEAEREIKIPLNKGQIPQSITPDKVREILEFYRERLQNEQPESDTLPILLTMIEDDIYRMFGVEFEVVERAYDYYWQDLQEFEHFFNSIIEARLIEEINPDS